ncbi:MAG: argininosuccinate lyase [Candidatus Marinimicrobia bacterium]|nr:argininosuccinate lyase [Candidatus Neomarinimicrobiota bacterium]MCF7828667.1 argininosuccinate lyase [Candidatus Neomarinimicrobiota bacterium]MCF7880408.1 argininosuccinate lyase [Candidatus Neomarinimicrobiota bacterium]
MKLWSPDSDTDSRIEAFTVGDDYELDQELVVYDCEASKAHAKMLGAIGILESAEVESLVEELEKIQAEAEFGEFAISPEQEDCHTAIEERLTESLGDTGKKIHTGRSRNDQVVTALRLYYRKQLDSMVKEIDRFNESANAFDERFGEVEIPGFTHTRKAMPSSMGMWVNAFISGMEDNKILLESTLEMLDQSPLGAGAGYGVPLNLDRAMTAEAMGFSRVQENPIATQNSRGKYEATILHGCSMIMLDLNKMASDLVNYSAPAYGFFELPEKLCTGSSIMPQKNNPDVFELVRAKYHQVAGWQQQAQNIAANLQSGYHRDLQLTKEPVMRGLRTTLESLDIMTYALENLGVNRDRCAESMTAELYATERAYELVKQGVPFRDAYRKISEDY